MCLASPQRKADEIMRPTVGIGIITYNRRDLVWQTVEAVRQFTRTDDAVMVVADDGSSDGTAQLLRERSVPVVTGANMGVAWNKNRALFLLSQILRCKAVILLEDDTHPTEAGWERDWLAAAASWGHINFLSPWMEKHVLSGAGTPDDPALSGMVTAQCAVYSEAALTYGGYFDPAFRGYGHEHIEHSRRLLRVGYGGTDRRVNGKEEVRYFMMKSSLSVVAIESKRDAESEERNFRLAQDLMGREGYRSPWGNDEELRTFRGEIELASALPAERFLVHQRGSRGWDSRAGMRLSVNGRTWRIG